MSFRDDPRYPEYRRKFVRETVNKASPEHRPFVSVHSAVSEHNQVHMAIIWWWNDTERDMFDPSKVLPGFWEPLDTGAGRYDAFEGAYTEAVAWARELGIEYHPPSLEGVKPASDKASTTTADAEHQDASSNSKSS